MQSQSDVLVRLVDIESHDFCRLSSKLDAELEGRYPGLEAEDPAPVDGWLAVAVAYRDDVPVGCGALRQLEPAVAEIKRVFVLPEGRRLGVARRVLEVLEMRAVALGFSAVRLGTGIRQPEALALYESAGYRRIPLFGEYEGGTLCVCYEKTLA